MQDGAVSWLEKRCTVGPLVETVECANIFAKLELASSNKSLVFLRSNGL
jgi:hypothetical protein